VHVGHRVHRLHDGGGASPGEPAVPEWSGNYDWQCDDDDVGYVGILDIANNNSDEDHDSAYRFRFLVGFGFVYIVFIAVLTLLGDSSNANQGSLDKLDDNNDDAP
jgi:hypothetical protein